MSSLALYRRYRPESFAEVIGQGHVTDPLQQALRNNRVNHAYLFSGPRGCGKTTSARILARCLNCEQGPTPTPCGECQSCQDLARNGPGSIDVIEIDAASHGGVDDARELREKAFFGPASSRYKIYIIDEAHMVTSAGFNALLKVVEEPPEHLKFIFATTEPEKVIGTIRSRTHHYPFRLVPPGTLREYLGDVCGRENIPVEEGVLPLVVRAGAGSVRDSMSVMDQLLAGAKEEGVTYAMATSLLGYTDGSLLDSVVEAFATGDGAAAFEVVDRIIEGGNDPRRFVADLLERLRDLVILAAVPDATEKGLIDAPADVLERMQAQAGIFGAAELSRAADLVNEGLTEMRGANSPRLQLELICARVMLPAAYGDERSVMARLDRLERGVNFSAGGGAGMPAMGYVPGPDTHAGAAAAPVVPGGGPAAARAAVRASGGPGQAPGPGDGPGGMGGTAAPDPAGQGAPTGQTPPAPAAPSEAPQSGHRPQPSQAPPTPEPAPAPAPTPAPAAAAPRPRPPPPPAPGPPQPPQAAADAPAAGPRQPQRVAARSPRPRRAAPRHPRRSSPRRPHPHPHPPPPQARPPPTHPRAAASTPACSGRTSWRRSRTAAASPGSCSARTPRWQDSTAPPSNSASSTPARVTTSRAAAARTSCGRRWPSSSTSSGRSRPSSTRRAEARLPRRRAAPRASVEAAAATAQAAPAVATAATAVAVRPPSARRLPSPRPRRPPHPRRPPRRPPPRPRRPSLRPPRNRVRR
ncbi:DNA polymerase III subunit gamma and tau [Streptomyces sp. NBC_00443]|uniref:DNA polymerase III subunit gamma and tau n=1 Tax=Streptomyces sp. NBC_00443 TaxID=2975743 RepID=UPI002E1B7BEC